MADLQDLTAQCIRCGFCLEACPTFQITADETQSPRGRIILAEEADRAHNWTESTFEAIDSCLGCRACEPVCPSGVHYGEILELARSHLTDRFPARKPFLNALTSPTLGPAQIALGELWPGDRVPRLVSRVLSGESPEARLPRLGTEHGWPPLEEQEMPAITGSVYLLEGCVMRSMFPGVHQALRRLLRRVGFGVHPVEFACCGALHAHAGYLEEAGSRARKLAETMPGDDPIVIDSAGCGSTIKEYGTIVGRGLDDFARRALDASEFLLQAGLVERLAESRGSSRSLRIAYHDACHLVHAQGIAATPRRLLSAIPGVELVPLDESDMCCGSAGTYNVFQPSQARTLLERKWRNIERAVPDIVALGNPGCHAWIAQAAEEHGSPVRVMHTIEVLESAFSGLPER